MSIWEEKIINAFIDHYYDGAPEKDESRTTLRLRSTIFFPDFDTCKPDERVSYLEAAESLERKGIIKLNWERRGRGERLRTLNCENFEKLFEEAKKPFPKTEAEIIRSMFGAKVRLLRETQATAGKSADADNIVLLLDFFSRCFGPYEIGQGIDRKTADDFIRLLEYSFETAHPEKITTRALSVLLYSDSKRLENLVTLYKPLVSKAEKTIPVPDFSHWERSYPETMISGKIIINYKDEKAPLINTAGNILGIPLGHAEKILSIDLVSGKKERTVLSIENKETFYALGNPLNEGNHSADTPCFDCFLYAGGYSNRSTAAIIRALAASGFTFYHAGDLDPDGILILQNIQNLAAKPVIPLRMDVETFDRFLPWGRSLTKTMLNQIKKITAETKALPGIAGLLKRIIETGKGIEQEIVNYW